MYSVLFIDDDTNLLNGLRRGMRPLHDQFSFSFAETHRAALTSLRSHSFDIVVSDMRMPGMEGAEVLEHVRLISPDAVRVILSGQSSVDSFLRALPTTHRYLSKPSTLDNLRSLALELPALRNLVPEAALRQKLTAMERIPIKAATYHELTAANRISEGRLTELATHDLGLFVKILHLCTAGGAGLADWDKDMVSIVRLLPSGVVEALPELSRRVFRPESHPFINQLSEIGEKLAEPVAENHASGASVATLAARLLPIGALVKFGLEENYPNEISATEAIASSVNVSAFMAALWGLPRAVAGTLVLQARRFSRTAHGSSQRVHSPKVLKTSTCSSMPDRFAAGRTIVNAGNLLRSAWCSQFGGADGK